MRVLIATASCLLLLLATGCSEEQKEPLVVVPSTEKASEKTTSPAPQQIFQTISPVAASELLEKSDGVLLVDVRTPQEIKQMRIKGAVAIPVGDVIRGRIDVPATQPVLLVCAVGGRSYIAGKALASRGHMVVYNLQGGVDAWFRAGLPIETNM